MSFRVMQTLCELPCHPCSSCYLDHERLPSGRQLLDPLRHTLRLLTESGLEPPRGKDTVETLLSASKFEELSDKENLLTMATRL